MVSNVHYIATKYALLNSEQTILIKPTSTRISGSSGRRKNPRIEWDLAIIVKLHPVEDNIEGSASVRRENGTVIKRSINMLIPFDIFATDDSTWSQELPETSNDVDKETQAHENHTTTAAECKTKCEIR